jgi:hypothetical protein
MDENKLIFGKILGEIYRLQRKQGICQASEGQIFGLLNGIDEALNTEFENLNLISNSKVSQVCDYLDPYYRGERDLDEIPSFQEMKMDLERIGINHTNLIIILKYLYSNERYTMEIEKLGNFKLSDYDI